MYDFNDIEALLRSGVSAEDIAQSFTDKLNAAVVATTPTPMEEASEKLAEAWNEMVDLYYEEHDLPSYMENMDNLYIDTQRALDLFVSSMKTMYEIEPLMDSLQRLVDKLKEEEENKPEEKKLVDRRTVSARKPSLVGSALDKASKAKKVAANAIDDFEDLVKALLDK